MPTTYFEVYYASKPPELLAYFRYECDAEAFIKATYIPEKYVMIQRESGNKLKNFQ